MAPDGISLSGVLDGRASTLAAVMDAVECANILDGARRNMITALRHMERVAGKPLWQIPFTAKSLRNLLDRDDWGTFGFSKRNWQNTTSGVRRAIRTSGLSPFPNSVPRVPLTHEWETLLTATLSGQEMSMVKRLGHFCSARQIAPTSVTNDTVRAFLKHLEDVEMSKNPERITRTTIGIWNRKVAATGAVLTLASRGHRDFYILPWSAFPEGLEDDACAYKRASLGESLLDSDGRVVRRSTAEKRHRMIRQFASAMTRSGILPHDLVDLTALTKPNRVKKGLEFLLARNGGAGNQQAFGMIHEIKIIAEHWAKRPQSDVEQLATWRKKLQPKERGLTQQNKNRLAPFTNETVLRRLIELPYTLVRRAERMERSHRAAMLMQQAVAIIILLHAPIRIYNLRNLEWEVHFSKDMGHRAAEMVLTIPPEDVKNDVPLTFPVPPSVVDMLRRYMRDYRSLLTSQNRSFLFPGRPCGPKTENAMRRLIEGAILRELGLTVNPHLFRHLAALVILNAHPGQYETVRRLLGHNSLTTTIQAYCGQETTAASEQLNAILASKRSGVGS